MTSAVYGSAQDASALRALAGEQRSVTVPGPDGQTRLCTEREDRTPACGSSNAGPVTRANSFAKRYVGTLRRVPRTPPDLWCTTPPPDPQRVRAALRPPRHRSREQRLPLHKPGQAVNMTARIRRGQVIHGLINEYQRAAWRAQKTRGQSHVASSGRARGLPPSARSRARYGSTSTMTRLFSTCPQQAKRSYPSHRRRPRATHPDCCKIRAFGHVTGQAWSWPVA